MRRSTLLQSLYQLIRLSPIGAFLLFGTFPSWIDATQIEAPVTATIVAVVILALWGMAESMVLLWLRTKPLNTEAKPSDAALRKSRGYVIVTIIIALSLLPFLRIFRGRVTEVVFVSLFIALSLRGLSRSAFAQGKLPLAAITTFLSATLLALMSFGIFRPSEGILFAWQAVLIGIAFGGALLATELSWHLPNAIQYPPQATTLGKWWPPIFRLAVFSPPVIIATLAFLGQLPLAYSFLYLTVPLGHRAVQAFTQTATTDISEHTIDALTRHTILAVAGLLCGCLLCKGYSNGWFF